MKKIFLVLLIGGVLLAAGCSSSRKCNGSKGTRVPMGVM